MPQGLRDLFRSLIAGQARWPLYIWSASPGTGKTSAALALLDHCGPIIGQMGLAPDVEEIMAGFIDFTWLPGIMRNATKGRYSWHENGRGGPLWESMIWAHLRRIGLVVIDDVRRPSAHEQTLGDDHYGLLKRLLDERVDRPIVVTSNIDPQGSPSELVSIFDDRIADRLLSGSVVELKGDSLRRAA